MDFEKRAEDNEKPLSLENLEKNQEQRIKELVDIVKECEELLITCKNVLKYTSAASIMGKRIDEVLTDISQIDL